MSLTLRTVAGVLAGLLALYVLKALGVPFWRSWDIGDQADGFVTAWCLVWTLTAPRTPPDPAGEQP